MGLLLLLGLFTRWTLVVGALTIVALIFGTTLRNDFQTVALQLTYAVIYFLLLFLRDYNRLSLDHLRDRP